MSFLYKNAHSGLAEIKVGNGLTDYYPSASEAL
jgi:hypothetical protein